MAFPALLKLKFVCLTLLFLTISCGSSKQTITVFAASSLTDAFGELATAYEAQNPDIEVAVNFAGSSQLAAQLREGIRGDVFASANPTQMDAVIEAGRVEAIAVQTFATNRLTLIVPTDNPANIQTLEDLADFGVQLLLAAEGVPVRGYADELFGGFSADFSNRVYNNLVSEEDNVRVVVAKIALGEADAGIVYASDVTPDIADQVQQIGIPDALNVTATYPIAPLIDAENPAQAQAFVEFVLSEQGQAILARWGLAE